MILYGSRNMQKRWMHPSKLPRQRLEIVKQQQAVGLANDADLFQSQVDLNTQLQSLIAQQLVIDQDKTDLLA